MTEEQGGDFAVVFSGQITEADLIKFVLEEAGIRCWLENQQMGTMLRGIVSPAGAGDVSVVVAPEDAERAKAEIQRSRQDETTEED
ncbi:MAG: putative signal transducing protein [Planctomycetota bacterium]|jgi:hypothetical protein